MFQKKFFGQDTSSHKGRYRYRRPGLLDKIPHIKLIRGVLITDKKHLEQITDFLKEYNAEVYTRKIECSREDSKKLNPPHE